MAAKKVARSEDDVKSWLSTQGYALEHMTALALKRAGFVTKLARPYRDPVEGKVREIDVLASPTFAAPSPFVLAIECRSTAGAWLIRTTASLVREDTVWRPIVNGTIGEYFEQGAILIGKVKLTEPTGFSVVEAAPENGTYAAISQAVSGAIAIAEQLENTIVFPVLVVNAPLFTVTYDDGNEAVASVQHYCVLWTSSAVLKHPTAVWIVSAEGLRDRMLELRTVFEDFNTQLAPQGQRRTAFGASA